MTTDAPERDRLLSVCEAAQELGVHLSGRGSPGRRPRQLALDPAPGALEPFAVTSDGAGVIAVDGQEELGVFPHGRPVNRDLIAPRNKPVPPVLIPPSPRCDVVSRASPATSSRSPRETSFPGTISVCRDALTALWP